MPVSSSTLGVTDFDESSSSSSSWLTSDSSWGELLMGKTKSSSVPLSGKKNRPGGNILRRESSPGLYNNQRHFSAIDNYLFIFNLITSYRIRTSSLWIGGGNASSVHWPHPVTNALKGLKAFTYKSVKTGLFLKSFVATNVAYFWIIILFC